jgi:hypothetical protein
VDSLGIEPRAKAVGLWGNLHLDGPSIDAGSYGSVYKATHGVSGRQYAVKRSRLHVKGQGPNTPERVSPLDLWGC